MAGARNKLWWMVPEWGSAASDLPPETQFLLVELREGGPYAVVLPLIDNNTFRGTLRGRRCAPSQYHLESLLANLTQSVLPHMVYLPCGLDRMSPFFEDSPF